MYMTQSNSHLPHHCSLQRYHPATGHPRPPKPPFVLVVHAGTLAMTRIDDWLSSTLPCCTAQDIKSD